MPVKVFCSYSHQDRDLKERLKKHLSTLQRKGRITAYWSDEKLSAGTEFDPAIESELGKADLILVLLSASYSDSDYCWNRELLPAVGRHRAGVARVVPILLSAMNWDVPPINQLTIIPRNLKAVTSWPNTDEAFAEITHEIDRVIDEVEIYGALVKARPAGEFQRPPLDVTLPTASTPISGNDMSTVFHCVLQFDDPVALRSTGIAELLPDLVLQFRGDPGECRFADIWLYANTNITSRIVRLGGLSEATISLATGHSITRFPTLRHNFRAVQSRVNALAFLQVPLHELRSLPQAERNLRIANVRVSAAQLGVFTIKPTEIVVSCQYSGRGQPICDHRPSEQRTP